MQIICRYSGLSFQSTSFMQLKVLEGSHPIMSVDPRILLSRARDWADGNLNEVEKKLLFIALLKSTDLVEFRRPAYPTNQTIQRNMEYLLRTLAWRHATGPKFLLPKFVVDKGTQDLKSVPAWLDKWNDERDYFLSRQGHWELREKIQLREAAMQRLLGKDRKTPSFYKNLARWVIEVSDAPKVVEELWTNIFLLDTDVKIWAADTEVIQELLKYMINNIDAGSIFANLAFKHIRSILIKNQGGLEYGLGMTSISDLDIEDIKSKGYILLPSSKTSMEVYNDSVAIRTAPSKLPERADYQTELDFLRAKIKWKKLQEHLQGQKIVLDNEKQQEVDLNLSLSLQQEDGELGEDEEEDELLGDVRRLSTGIIGE
jgi:hypothetical protein